MPPTLITGQRGTGTPPAIRRVVDVADRIALLEPSATPLAVLLMKLSRQVTVNPKFDWLEDELMTRETTYTGATEVAPATTIAVASSAHMVVNDIIYNPATQEVMLVTVINSATSIDVTRNYGQQAGTPLLTLGDTLISLGTAMQENSTAPTAKTTQEVDVFNYTQIFRHPFGVSETLKNSELFGGNDLDYQRKKKGIEHITDLERAFLFGNRREDLSGAQPRRTTRGIVNWITTNVTNMGGSMSELELEEWLRTGFRYGSSTKFVFGSSFFISQVSVFARGRLQTFPKDQTYGIAISRYVSPHGEINLIKHNILTALTFGAALLDLEALKYRWLQNRDTKLNTNIQANDADGETDEYITECGLELRSEKRHALATGISAVA